MAADSRAAVTPPPLQSPSLPQSPSPPPSPQLLPQQGDDGGGAAQAAFDDAVRVDLLRQGERYLVFAPAADRIGSDAGGSVSEVEQAGIGVLSVAARGQYAEFRRLSVDLVPDGSSRTYRGVRDVALEELGGFCFERKLCPGRAPVPDVGVEACSSDEDDVFAVAMGLLQPTSGTGLLAGCDDSDWHRVWELRGCTDPYNRHGLRDWRLAIRRRPQAERVASSTAQAMDVLLAYAVGMCHPRAIPGQGGGGRWPTVSDWRGVAALVADLVHARATTLLGHAKAAVLTEMIAGCELARAERQARAEERHPPAVMCRGVELEDWLKRPGCSVCDLKMADLRALIVCRTGVTKVSGDVRAMDMGQLREELERHDPLSDGRVASMRQSYGDDSSLFKTPRSLAAFAQVCWLRWLKIRRRADGSAAASILS